jgi:hypothetical protein
MVHDPIALLWKHGKAQSSKLKKIRRLCRLTQIKSIKKKKLKAQGLLWFSAFSLEP